MGRRLVIAIGLLVAVVLAMTVVDPVDAGSEGRRGGHRADGIWCYTPQFDRLGPVALDPEYTGPKSFITTVEEAEWTGVFEGDSMDYGAVGIPSADSGPTTFAATVVFDSVDVRRRTGGLELDVSGIRRSDQSDWRGEWVITSGTGELEGATGYGDWWGPGYLTDTPDECGVIYYDVDRLRIRRGGRT